MPCTHTHKHTHTRTHTRTHTHTQTPYSQNKTKADQLNCCSRGQLLICGSKYFHATLIAANMLHRQDRKRSCRQKHKERRLWRIPDTSSARPLATQNRSHEL